MAAGISPEEFHAYVALIAGSTLLQRAVERNLREQADLTQVQFEILMNLSNAGDAGIRMAQLADALIVSRSGLSYQVAQLESRRSDHRERFVEDDAGVVARITPKGERMRRRVFAGHIDIVRGAFLDAIEPGELAASRVLNASPGGSDSRLASHPVPARDTIHVCQQPGPACAAKPHGAGDGGEHVPRSVTLEQAVWPAQRPASAAEQVDGDAHPRHDDGDERRSGSRRCQATGS